MPLLRRRDRPPLRLARPAALVQFLRDGAAPLSGAAPGASLRVAVVVPQFRRGSGGHKTIADLVRGLEARGHALSLWVEDEEGRHEGEEVDGLWHAFFGRVDAPVRLGFDGWDGADIVLATGWQTVHRALLLQGVAARAYLVQDHEPEFYGTSAQRLWAEQTYALGLHPICASPWLAGLVREGYGVEASAFDLGVDHETYTALPTHRRDDLVLFYARAVTARRAVPLGLLALEELKRRRPKIEVALFGEARPIALPFRYLDLGVMSPDKLAHAYASAAVGLCLSMTNPSLVPTEMMACGLPVVDLDVSSMRATFGADGPVELAAPDPLALCDAIERLLDDLVLRAERSRAGAELVATRTWARAAEQVEAGLRAAFA
ncbi:MAG: glycosyltransferase family 4 protein [Actinobacteria bacterium]|nr:MAG: glycosyltransferase family 4 protein [Actinomycetota bacterium]